MTERDDALRALHIGVGTVSPEHAASEGYAKAIKAVQDVTKRQGHVMSEALDNNARLWEEYKRLKNIETHMETVKRENARLRVRDRELTQAMETLQACGGDRYKVLYEDARRTLNLYLSDALDEAELEERVKKLDNQKAVLDQDGVAKAKLPDRGAIDAHMAREGLGADGEDIADLGDL